MLNNTREGEKKNMLVPFSVLDIRGEIKLHTCKELLACAGYVDLSYWNDYSRNVGIT